MKTYPELGAAIGELVELKAEAYGRSHAKCGLYLRLLWPNGIPPNRYTEAMLLARDFDKSMRIATDAAAFGESPWDDKAGYALLGAQLHQKIEEPESCVNASGPNAKDPPKEQPDSAAPSTSARITTSGREKTDTGPLPQPDGYSGPLESAPAPIATEAASASLGDQRLQPRNVSRQWMWIANLMRQCNSLGLCANCGPVIDGGALRTATWGESFILCRSCRPSDFQQVHRFAEAQP
jgi:hypothetical protein